MIYFVIGLLGALLPQATHAHVKWFVDDAAPAVQPLQWDEPGVLAWIGISLLLLIAATVIEVSTHPSKKFLLWVKDHRAHIEWSANILIGLGLIVNAFTNVVLIPTAEANTAVLIVAQVAQGIAGGLLLFNLWRQIAGMLIAVTAVLLTTSIGVVPGLEHLLFFGIAFYLIVEYAGEKNPVRHWRVWGIPVLRITAGISLITLALQEKLLHPELALAFLEAHPWNFMQMVGIEQFSDRLFIISAGFTELIFGVVLVSGLITRINTAVMSLFFVTTAVVLGVGELVGHLPIFGAALLLIVFGAGDKMRLHRKKI